MATQTITKQLEFAAAHRIYGHENKCKDLHGHTYTVELTITAPGLDSLGRIIDFGSIKDIAKKYIDENLDHNILLGSSDPIVALWNKNRDQAWASCLFTRHPFIMSFPPTAENIARIIFFGIVDKLPTHLTLTRVRLYETPRSWADYVP